MTTAVLERPPETTAASQEVIRRARRRRRLRRVGLNGVAVFVFLIFAFPVYWMLTTSFRRGVDIQSPNPTFLPFPGTLENFRKVFERPYFWDALRTSLIVTLSVVVIAVFVAFLTAVALARFHFFGRKALIIAVIVVQMVPQEALIISLFKVLDGWKLTNTIIGLSLTYIMFVLPFTIWVLRGFVGNIPRELEEAAIVDGATRLRAFFTITFPLVAPGLVATGVFAFIQAWNEYIFAYILLSDQQRQTVTIWLSNYLGTGRGTDWGGLMAGATLIAIPVVIFFLFVQRRIAFGLTAGAVRG